MKNLLFICLTFINLAILNAQTKTEYSITFENAAHHEARINISYSGLPKENLKIRMSRSSPGRYATHEFAKNVYALSAVNGKGDTLSISRKDSDSWEIENHDGSINIQYTLFANRADGTYSQIDETHAHLNMPATFIYAEDLQANPITINFNPREDLNWKVATQLKHLKDNTYQAPNLQYFMDSPTEISNYEKKTFEVNSNGTDYKINFVLHEYEPSEKFEAYFENVKKIVLAEMAVYGELPNYDFGEYTFLACYMPHVNGDGMEHRNSTILTDRDPLEKGGFDGNIGTVAHEYFHSWNVERIRPSSLEPFDFSKANMSGALWFAEGFTSYYTNLTLCRAGIIDEAEYIKRLNGTFNYVWNSPARKYFNPIEMSYQAPFVDAATALDPVNRTNTFISYYSYGSVLGLALDLSLRKEGLNLDNYMKLIWEQYGQKEKPYTIENLKTTLGDYAGNDFANNFFNNYIYKSKMPDYNTLFDFAGVELNRDQNKPYTGIDLSSPLIKSDVKEDSPAYIAGLEKGDEIMEINGIHTTNPEALNTLILALKPQEILNIKYKRFDEERSTSLRTVSDPAYTIKITPDANKEQLKQRKLWLQPSE